MGTGDLGTLLFGCLALLIGIFLAVNSKVCLLKVVINLSLVSLLFNKAGQTFYVLIHLGNINNSERE